MKRINAGTWTGIFLLLFSFVLLYQSFAFSYSDEYGPGPGFFPVWLSGSLLILSLLYIYESIRTHDSAQEPVMPRGEGLKKNLFVAFSLIMFVVLLNFAGFVLSGVIFLYILLYKAYRWYISAGISLGVTLFVFWLFSSIFGIPLPVNGFGW